MRQFQRLGHWVTDDHPDYSDDGEGGDGDGGDGERGAADDEAERRPLRAWRWQVGESLDSWRRYFGAEKQDTRGLMASLRTWELWTTSIVFGVYLVVLPATFLVSFALGRLEGGKSGWALLPSTADDVRDALLVLRFNMYYLRFTCDQRDANSQSPDPSLLTSRL